MTSEELKSFREEWRANTSPEYIAVLTEMKLYCLLENANFYSSTAVGILTQGIKQRFQIRKQFGLATPIEEKIHLLVGMLERVLDLKAIDALWLKIFGVEGYNCLCGPLEEFLLDAPDANNDWRHPRAMRQWDWHERIVDDTLKKRIGVAVESALEGVTEALQSAKKSATK